MVGVAILLICLALGAIVGVVRAVRVKRARPHVTLTVSRDVDEAQLKRIVVRAARGSCASDLPWLDNVLGYHLDRFVAVTVTGSTARNRWHPPR